MCHREPAEQRREACRPVLQETVTWAELPVGEAEHSTAGGGGETDNPRAAKQEGNKQKWGNFFCFCSNYYCSHDNSVGQRTEHVFHTPLGTRGTFERVMKGPQTGVRRLQSEQNYKRPKLHLHWYVVLWYQYTACICFTTALNTECAFKLPFSEKNTKQQFLHTHTYTPLWHCVYSSIGN